MRIPAGGKSGGMHAGIRSPAARGRWRAATPTLSWCTPDIEDGSSQAACRRCLKFAHTDPFCAAVQQRPHTDIVTTGDAELVVSQQQQVLECLVLFAISSSTHHQPAGALVLRLLSVTANLRPDPTIQEAVSRGSPCPSTSMASPCCAPGPAGCNALQITGGSPGGSPRGSPGVPQEARARIWARRERCSWARAPHISSQACRCGRTLSMRPARRSQLGWCGFEG